MQVQVCQGDGLDEGTVVVMTKEKAGMRLF